MACPRKALGRLKACFLTVTSIQTREALGTRPTLGGASEPAGPLAPRPPPPPLLLAKLWAFNQPLSPHSVCSGWKK